MKVRILQADFSSVKPHWAPSIEFAHTYSAGSTIPAYIEPYLCKVMVKGKSMLPEKYTKLHEEVAIFIKQEMQHCKKHIAFNKMLSETYPAIRPLEAKYAASYEHFLSRKSMQFNVAYSEGFEAFSAIAMAAIFEDFDEFWAGCDPIAEALWKWHCAEEYEHRTVMHDFYHALYGKGVFSYFYRVYGFFYAMIHLTRHMNSVAAAMLAQDRAGMTETEVARSKAVQKKIGKIAGKHALANIVNIISPFYDPSKRPAPRGVLEILAHDDAPVPIEGSAHALPAHAIA
jgi:predicted metal-dependent hydrolase